MFNVSDDRIKRIGQIIEKERKAKGWKNADDLADELNTTRQAIRDWEKGKKSPTLHDLVRMCELFDCDFGYLVGEYDCKTRLSTDIHKETGLSEKSIHQLSLMKLVGYDMVLWFNQLVEHDEFIEMMWALLRLDDSWDKGRQVRSNAATDPHYPRRDYESSFYIQEAQNHLRRAIEEILKRRDENNAPQE